MEQTQISKKEIVKKMAGIVGSDLEKVVIGAVLISELCTTGNLPASVRNSTGMYSGMFSDAELTIVSAFVNGIIATENALHSIHHSSWTGSRKLDVAMAAYAWVEGLIRTRDMDIGDKCSKGRGSLIGYAASVPLLFGNYCKNVYSRVRNQDKVQQ